jgi:transcriptional regulator with XRE-family HTH domain
MKNRIKQVMESLHMTQMEFAEKTQIGAATLSNIFNDRTRPSLNVVELIKKNIPSISTDWLLLGVGSMYVDKAARSESETEESSVPFSGVLPFADYSAPTPQQHPVSPNFQANQKIVRNETNASYTPTPEKPQRKVTEIRVYYDDQTWESFTPSKSKS